MVHFPEISRDFPTDSIGFHEAEEMLREAAVEGDPRALQWLGDHWWVTSKLGYAGIVWPCLAINWWVWRVLEGYLGVPHVSAEYPTTSFSPSKRGPLAEMHGFKLAVIARFVEGLTCGPLWAWKNGYLPQWSSNSKGNDDQPGIWGYTIFWQAGSNFLQNQSASVSKVNKSKNISDLCVLAESQNPISNSTFSGTKVVERLLSQECRALRILRDTRYSFRHHLHKISDQHPGEDLGVDIRFPRGPEVIVSRCCNGTCLSFHVFPCHLCLYSRLTWV